jgi:hypothetical protein
MHWKHQSIENFHRIMKFLRFFAVFLLLQVSQGHKTLKCDFEVAPNGLYTCVIRDQDFGDGAVEFDTSDHRKPVKNRENCDTKGNQTVDQGVTDQPTTVSSSTDQLTTLPTTTETTTPPTTTTERNFNLEVKQMQIFDSRMKSLPDLIFKTFPNLQVLFVNANLSSWNKNYLKGASNLKTLYIYENGIKTFWERAFEEVPQLEFLWIEKTKMTEIKPNMFKPLKNLKSLTIRNHKLSGGSIPIGTFNALQNSLVSLDISMNSIKNFPEGFFLNFTSLETLNIDGNRLNQTINATSTLPPNLKFISVCRFDEFSPKDPHLTCFFYSRGFRADSRPTKDLGSCRLIVITLQIKIRFVNSRSQ